MINTVIMTNIIEKDKIFWTKSMNLNLVKFLKAKPYIWNSKHPRYTSSELRERAYAEFARKYGREFTGDIVKQRWTNIRSAFTHYLRKKKAAQEAGKEFSVKWHLWDACQFLRKCNKSPRKADLDYVASSSIEATPTSDDSDNTESKLDTGITNNQVNCQEFSQQLVNVFKNFQNDAFGLDNTRNAAVGKAVAKELSKMNSYQAAMACHKISEILLLYDDLNPSNPNTRLKSETCFSDFDGSE